MKNQLIRQLVEAGELGRLDPRSKDVSIPYITIEAGELQEALLEIKPEHQANPLGEALSEASDVIQSVVGALAHKFPGLTVELIVSDLTEVMAEKNEKWSRQIKELD